MKQTYKEIERTDKLLFICPFCKLSFKGLAYHTLGQAQKLIGKAYLEGWESDDSFLLALPIEYNPDKED